MWRLQLRQLVVVATLLAVSSHALSYERVRLAASDSGDDQTRHLFRGDVPTWVGDNSHFDRYNPHIPVLYDTLIEYFKRRLAEAQLPPPLPPYYIIDVNLLSNTSIQQRNSIDSERNYFNVSPTRGRFIHWPTVGTSANPHPLNVSERQEQLNNFSEIDVDQLTYRIPHLHTLMTTKVTVPVDANGTTGLTPGTVFVYVHCIGGQDRTGEIMGSYALQYLGWNATAAFDWDWLVAERWPHLNQRLMMTWYCLYLEDVFPLQYSNLQCLRIPGVRTPTPSEPCPATLSFEDCGLNKECLWNTPGRYCMSNCVRWPTEDGCAKSSSHCHWVVSNATAGTGNCVFGAAPPASSRGMPPYQIFMIVVAVAAILLGLGVFCRKRQRNKADGDYNPMPTN